MLPFERLWKSLQSVSYKRLPQRKADAPVVSWVVVESIVVLPVTVTPGKVVKMLLVKKRSLV